MTITIKYFGIIAEELGRAEETLELGEGTSRLSDLAEKLKPNSATLQKGNFQAALNHYVVQDAVLGNGDEIALLPPFSGG